jgi:hypothetical protein
MSTRETSPEIASMAGRILTAGNPLDNDQVILAVIEGLAEANTGKQAQAALRTMFDPYFTNALSLAGSCLSQAEPDEQESDAPPRVVITATVDWEKIVNAIIGAFEGGSTYWLREADYTYSPEGVEGNPLYAETQFWAKGGQMTLKYDDPDDQERRAEKIVSLIEIKQGLRSMAEKAPRHFGDLVSENDDATTHDVFIQHVLFGDIIYG